MWKLFKRFCSERWNHWVDTKSAFQVGCSVVSIATLILMLIGSIFVKLTFSGSLIHVIFGCLIALITGLVLLLLLGILSMIIYVYIQWLRGVGERIKTLTTRKIKRILRSGYRRSNYG